MISLEVIKKDIKNIAEVISSVLNVDVTIVDKDLTRIAGTGKYRNKIGEKVSLYSAFRNSLDTGKSFIIENPRFDKICQMCKGKKDCKEFAEVCCPIRLYDKIYGVIGLIAFSKEQRDNIMKNKKELMDFLAKMADFISSKIEAENKSYELKLEAKRLEMLLNNMDKAVVSTDIHGNIDKYNDKLKKIFNLKDSFEKDNIFNLFSFIKMEDIKGIKERYKSTSFVYKKEGHTLRGIYNINPIIIDTEVKGYVFDFIDNYSAIKEFNEITGADYNIKFNNIIGNSQLMKKVKKEAQIASKSSSTVLIIGESGTGKELFARAIHNNSNRHEGPFIAINCAAIPDNLLESELFGYEEGAFTGAKKGGKLGKFELANKGTIFLDEIGDMSLHLQGKLLRVLQEREVEKIGGKANISVDVRIIAATNKNLESMVEKGEFREDLYYRLNVIPINIPPLRERREDISLLIESIIDDYSNKLNKVIYGIDDEAMKRILHHSWPGNVRQLQNVIEYSINMASSNIIKYEDLPQKLKDESKKMFFNKEEEITPIKELEKKEIIKALDKFKEYKKDKEKAADALGISRATLYRKLKEYKIN
ncbi:sigma-54 interaction domain-containing protein [Tepidibacter formicigenes]|jgi:transcriptional regulator with PAS, ATPase and Fis domain|uniref:Transcriptional regulator containing PAS, AAA-type ATPase, and DNA-binding Fis domains n=1 Tax=Tepidibacter formicigenes DSM 15518 TaxID=1123349 RepID=A0A1M6MMC9_9FIRM|nr:sigma 54-interacting transcriptional regulator [Tepidibacter formicigenes]SHJ84443.1 Transcriptional regulator containing PAS, AAA-type ATPase, and DNA-binding Fis domains [Tepidibacter formicigenes DSM 15518]